MPLRLSVRRPESVRDGAPGREPPLSLTSHQQTNYNQFILSFTSPPSSRWNLGCSHCFLSPFVMFRVFSEYCTNRLNLSKLQYYYHTILLLQQKSYGRARYRRRCFGQGMNVQTPWILEAESGCFLQLDRHFKCCRYKIKVFSSRFASQSLSITWCILQPLGTFLECLPCPPTFFFHKRLLIAVGTDVRHAILCQCHRH